MHVGWVVCSWSESRKKKRSAVSACVDEASGVSGLVWPAAVGVFAYLRQCNQCVKKKENREKKSWCVRQPAPKILVSPLFLCELEVEEEGLRAAAPNTS
jgi:hypothetical protein